MAAGRLLAGDIGGSKVVLGLLEPAGPAPPVLIEQRRFPSRDFHDLESICDQFLRERAAEGGPAAAAFGIAGPIVEGRTETTNLPWVIEQGSLERRLGCPVALLNDLEATAHGIAALGPSEIHVLNEGHEIGGAPRALIAAGTGLGEGYMVFDPASGRYRPSASEGGHCDFAPRGPVEVELLKHLWGRLDHVSVERVVSGMGIREIFDFLVAAGRHEPPGALLEAFTRDDPAAAISAAAMGRTHPICVETMRVFVSCYGAEAGNLALKTMSLGGLYVGGGIAPRILPLLTDGTFMGAFLDKGRFTSLMARIPVRIILNDRAALLGAGLVAARLAR